MKVIDCCNILISTNKVASYLKMFVLDMLDKVMNSNGKAHKSLEALIKLYGLKNIHKAINSIYGKNGCVYVPTKGKSGEILRYLEYGGEGIGQTKIISQAVSLLNSKIGGDLHVF